jgi:hypothetical protein
VSRARTAELFCTFLPALFNIRGPSGVKPEGGDARSCEAA